MAMMGLPITVGEFRLYADVELRFTQSGKAVATVPLIASDRKKNDQTNEWEDTDVLAVRGTVWDQVAENVANSLQKGDQVTVAGKMYVRRYESNGQQRQSVEMKILSIGPTLQFRSTPHGAQDAPQSAPQQQTQGYAQGAPQGAQGAPQAAQQGYPQQQRYPQPPQEDMPPF